MVSMPWCNEQAFIIHFFQKHNKQLAEKRFYLLKIRLTKHLIIIEAFKIVRVGSV